jgi:hypothetical protein
MSKEDLWKRDLKEFLEKLDEVEQNEKDDAVVSKMRISLLNIFEFL